MKIKKKTNYKSFVTEGIIATICLLIGITIGILICPQKEYSSCLDLAEQDKLIVSQDGVITDLAIDTFNGRNKVYNNYLTECLELKK